MNGLLASIIIILAFLSLINLKHEFNIDFNSEIEINLMRKALVDLSDCDFL